MAKRSPLVGIIMGSQSDWATHAPCRRDARRARRAHEARIVSAHRTPKRLYAYAEGARGRGLKAIIAGAGGAAHLPGMMASLTPLPVFGVPVESQVAEGPRQPALDRADAGRRARRHARHRRGRRDQRGAAGGGGAGAHRQEDRQAARRLARQTAAVARRPAEAEGWPVRRAMRGTARARSFRPAPRSASSAAASSAA